jgi:alpha-L-fucosidase
LGTPATFRVIRVREAIQFGQRVDAIAIHRWEGGSWHAVAEATSVGSQRVIRLESAVTAARLRLRVTAASASPILSEFGLFAEA